ncbi:U32 family peptidase [Ectothiorhodospira haloalkaliphila]|uniref:ubiquinone anaerobic biosynthesis protein UbiV n=1 Tax=Ectothiorhodospira haloalkaliphila TaxID=421628 RepID=UPI001EE978A7|nr:U32 family peptidase [Ectothiorhodospira haloalkaliphila]MCG5525069.1 U32 family peptidase [Ectothiorhodospira haloalkaliphila]
MKLSLGPIPYYWPRERVMDFYKAIETAPVDIVYLSETVCSKRRELRAADWLELADRLSESGKTVVMSTLALMEAESERLALERLVNNGRYMIEANDATGLGLSMGKPFVAGPHINTYNAGTLKELADVGAVRWVMPVELSRDILAAMHAARPEGLETEVWGFGRLPLAFSARCFTARARNLPKDSCELACIDYPGGLSMSTQDGKGFLTINGIELQSADPCNLIEAVPELMDMGVEVLRISPEPEGTEQVIQAFRDCVEGTRSSAQAMEQIRGLYPRFSNGYWKGEAGMNWQESLSA